MRVDHRSIKSRISLQICWIEVWSDFTSDEITAFDLKALTIFIQLSVFKDIHNDWCIQIQ